MRVSFIALFLSITLGYVGFLTATETGESSKPIGFFEAIDQGLMEASIVQNSSLDGRVTMKNKTKAPLVVEIPKAFAAVQVFQFGGDDLGGSTGGSSGRRSGSSGQNQSTGGGFGSMGGGMGGGGGGMGMGMFNLPPEKVVRQNVKTVCLEHGKGEPRRYMKYEMRPIESVTDKPEVHVLCNLVGTGSVDHQSAQAAVWHYNSGLSWEELAQKQYKPRIESPERVPYFSHQQMLYAMNLGKKIEERIAKEKEASQKTNESYSGK